MESLRQSVIQLHGSDGEKWFNEIPQVIRQYTQKWDLEIGNPYQGLLYNYVAEAKRKDGTLAVLKVGFPGDREFLTEIEALRVYDGNGAVRLLEADKEKFVSLVQRAVPGEKLGYSDQELRIACRLMRRLWKKVPNNGVFPTIQKWGMNFDKYFELPRDKQQIPQEVVKSAKEIFFELVSTSSPFVLLHGDLNLGNVLSNGKDWIAIDPKGVLGEPCYELGVLLRNPHNLSDSSDVKGELEKRIAIFSEELGFNPDRIREWGYSQAVLSAIWGLEDNSPQWGNSLKFARVLA